MKNRIKAMRWEKDWSLGQLSIKSGVSTSAINKIENAPTTNFTTETALRLAHAFNVKVEEMFDMNERTIN